MRFGEHHHNKEFARPLLTEKSGVAGSFHAARNLVQYPNGAIRCEKEEEYMFRVDNCVEPPRIADEIISDLQKGHGDECYHGCLARRRLPGEYHARHIGYQRTKDDFVTKIPQRNRKIGA